MIISGRRAIKDLKHDLGSKVYYDGQVGTVKACDRATDKRWVQFGDGSRIWINASDLGASED